MGAVGVQQVTQGQVQMANCATVSDTSLTVKWTEQGRITGFTERRRWSEEAALSKPVVCAMRPVYDPV